MVYDKEKRRQEYLAKLRDPRWQKKRLQIMQRDEFTCQKCFDSTTTLNVHHNFYQKNTEPWDYPDFALVTFCAECHKEETDNRRQEEEILLQVCREMGLHSSGLNGLYCALNAIGRYPVFIDNWDCELMWMIEHFWDLREVIKPLMEAELKERLLKRKERGELTE